MACTERFFVSSKDNKVRRTTFPERHYFNGTKECKYIIEVFGYGHSKVAKQVRDMVDASGMTNKIFTIKVETR